MRACHDFGGWRCWRQYRLGKVQDWLAGLKLSRLLLLGRERIRDFLLIPHDHADFHKLGDYLLDFGF